MTKQGSENGQKEKRLFAKISKKILALPSYRWTRTYDKTHENIFTTHIEGFYVLLSEWHNHYELKVSVGKEDVFECDSFDDEKLESLFESIANKFNKFVIQKKRNLEKSGLRRKKYLLTKFAKALEL